jgi:hypothetical protein
VPNYQVAQASTDYEELASAGCCRRDCFNALVGAAQLKLYRSTPQAVSISPLRRSEAPLGDAPRRRSTRALVRASANGASPGFGYDPDCVFIVVGPAALNTLSPEHS